MAALHRDNFAAVSSKVDEAQICSLAEHQLSSLENLVLQQRRAQIRIARVLKDAEIRHRKVVQELVEEKRKHEHDTAQGDDITYGLEKERTRLKQELEMERQSKKRLEKELKKLSEIADEEKNRQKQIVLLLLAERKKIIMKYVEERKRSEDLAQILTEEKGRMDSMAEGLEEESKKSLQMEAELEKQLAQFDSESQQLKANLLKEEKRAKDLESELERAKGEVASLEKQLAEAHQVAMFQANANLVGTMVHPRAPPPPSKPSIIPPQTSPRLTPPGKSSVWVEGSVEGGTPMMSVAKVVQPTATVSSVPVCGPSHVQPDHNKGKELARPMRSDRAPEVLAAFELNQHDSTRRVALDSATGIARSVSPGQSLRSVAVAFPSTTTATPLPVEVDKRSGGVTSGNTVVAAGVLPMAPRMASPATKLFPGQAKVPFLAADTKKQPAVGRGAPPPVPPNKPVVPPKKDTILCRRGDSAISVDEPKSSPQALKYGMTAKENKVVHSGAGAVGEQVGEPGHQTLHELPPEDLELELHQLSLNTSS
ncbi:CTTNBP2 N-terminal like [Homalodisca vitripennis]|nr:CTTNBP2 N-terminal like [Homalodisca vitripennis]